MIYDNVYRALEDAYSIILKYIAEEKYIILYVSKHLYNELEFLNVDSRIKIILDENKLNTYEFGLTKTANLIDNRDEFFELL